MGEGRGRLGTARALGWLAAAAWWAAKSPAGPRGLALAAAPWAACSLLSWPTGGLSAMLCVALYAPFSAWSAMRASEHFAGALPNPAGSGKAMAGGSMRGLAMLFAACAVAAMAWAHAWTRGTGLGAMLDELGAAVGPEAAREAARAYWAKEGLDGIAWAIGLQQAGIGLANAWWCLLPFAALAKPSATAGELARFGFKALAQAPGAMFALGLSGAAMAQASLAIAPLSLLSGVWFLACAFAYRDVSARVEP